MEQSDQSSQSVKKEKYSVYDYEKLSLLSKKERRNVFDEIKDKRFLFSRNPEIKKRIMLLHKTVKELKKEYPELISFNLFGSLSKGYAIEESDIDGVFFIDEDIAHKGDIVIAKEINGEIVNIPSDRYLNLFKQAIKEKLRLDDSHTKGIDIAYVSLHGIKKDLTSKQSLLFLPAYFISLFFLSLGGRDIVKYRREVFDILESQGKKGEEKWAVIMRNLAEFERGWKDAQIYDKSFYPLDMKKARKIFLNEK